MPGADPGHTPVVQIGAAATDGQQRSAVTMIDRVIPVDVVLEVAAEFDAYGVSCGFVAWELCESEAAIRPAWREAERSGMLEPFGKDGAHNEQLWRLTARGRAKLAGRATAEHA